MEKINFKGKFEKYSVDEDGNFEITINVGIRPKLEKGKTYQFNVKESKSPRSLEQNRKLWRTINQICLAQDGNLSGADDLYRQLLKMSGAKYEQLTMKYEALPSFTKYINGNVTVRNVTTVNNQLWVTIDMFYGSSTMDTKEMSKLIETAINYAYQIGVDVEDYDERDI